MTTSILGIPVSVTDGALYLGGLITQTPFEVEGRVRMLLTPVGVSSIAIEPVKGRGKVVWPSHPEAKEFAVLTFKNGKWVCEIHRPQGWQNDIFELE